MDGEKSKSGQARYVGGFNYVKRKAGPQSTVATKLFSTHCFVWRFLMRRPFMMQELANTFGLTQVNVIINGYCIDGIEPAKIGAPVPYRWGRTWQKKQVSAVGQLLMLTGFDLSVSYYSSRHLPLAKPHALTICGERSAARDKKVRNKRVHGAGLHSKKHMRVMRLGCKVCGQRQSPVPSWSRK